MGEPEGRGAAGDTEVGILAGGIEVEDFGEDAGVLYHMKLPARRTGRGE